MALQHSPSIVTDGLKVCLDAGNPRSYSSSTTWIDISGNNFNASLINGVGYNSGNLGSLTMDGVDNVILAPSVNSLGSMANQALEIWVKSPGLGSGKSLGGLICLDYGMCSSINPSGNITYYLYNSDAWPNGYYLFLMETTGANCFDNQWHHIVCTRNNSDAVIYVDGVVRAFGSGGGSWSGSTIWSSMSTQIGNNPNDAYYHLLGNIGVAKIYNKYLTSAEVAQNFNALRGRYGI